MKPWLRFVLFINTIGGAWAGLAAMATPLSTMEPGVANAALLAALITPFALGLYAGWLLMRAAPSAINWTRAYLVLQIPVLSSPIFGFQVISALGLGGSVGAIGAGLSTRLTFTYFASFGGGDWISIAQGAPIRIGLNLVPVVLLLLVNQVMQQARARDELT
jgi:hypothetical protein